MTESIPNIFVLSILEGKKIWELRENPDFGNAGNELLKIGDIIIIVSACEKSYIQCFCKVEEIVRNADFQNYFSGRESGHFLDAGFNDTNEDWEYFEQKVLTKYKTAVRLKTNTLKQKIYLENIFQLHTGKLWTGRGFHHINQLKRFGINGKNLVDVLSDLVLPDFL